MKIYTTLLKVNVQVDCDEDIIVISSENIETLHIENVIWRLY